MGNEICSARPHLRSYFHLMKEVSEDVDVE